MVAHSHSTAADAALEVGDETAGAMESIDRGGSEMVSGVGNFLSRMVYTTSYSVSYGVVFPAMLVARVVPRENALVHGLVDGAQAARARVFGWAGAGWDDGHDEMAGSELDDGAEEDSDEHEGSAASGGRRRRSGRAHRGGRKSSR